MTRERAKELASILLSYSKGNEIQCLNKENEWENCSPYEPVGSEGVTYRIKPEKKYVPFDNAKDLFEAVRKHGAWVHSSAEDYEDYYAIHTIYSNGVLIGDDNEDCVRGFDEIVKDFVWADDGTPCGKLVNTENLAD